jgi:hypothetical protein
MPNIPRQKVPTYLTSRMLTIAIELDDTPPQHTCRDNRGEIKKIFHLKLPWRSIHVYSLRVLQGRRYPACFARLLVNWID